MAVLDELDVKVQIVVNGRPLKEHAAPEEEESHDDNSVLTYVEVNESANYVVDISFCNSVFDGYEGIRCTLELDGSGPGQWTEPRPTTYQSRVLMSKTWTNVKLGGKASVKVGRPIEGRFRFSSLVTSEADYTLATQNPSTYQRIGEIQCTLEHAWKASNVPISANTVASRQICESAIPEKGLKGRAISHGITLDERPNPHVRTRFEYRTYKDKKPIGKFIFRYRSKEDLIKSGIIERSPEPDDVARMTTQQLQELVRRQRAELEERKQPVPRTLKREAEDGDGIPEMPRKRSRAPIETVDLTDD